MTEIKINPTTSVEIRATVLSADLMAVHESRTEFADDEIVDAEAIADSFAERRGLGPIRKHVLQQGEPVPAWATHVAIITITTSVPDKAGAPSQRAVDDPPCFFAPETVL